MRYFYYYIPIIFQKIGYIVFFSLYRVFVRIEIHGRECLKSLSGPIIFAANHTSELDVTAMPLVLPFFSTFSPIYFVANQTEKYKTFGWRSYIYGGIFFNLLGGYSVYSGKKNYAVALEDHISLLKKGRTICIFPEGKRTRDGTMNPARGGLGYMVYVTKATVVPIAINTFFNLNFWDFILCRRKVVLTIMPPLEHTQIISTTDPGVEDFRNGGQVVLDRIRKNLENEYS